MNFGQAFCFLGIASSPRGGGNLSKVGLGTSDPAYQLDLSTDGARKLTSTTWLTGSDERVKKNIEDANVAMCYSNVKNLKLRRFQWDSNFYPSNLVNDQNVVGWIAQEVATVFPKAVTTSSNNGFDDFMDLNADQLYKAMYGALQHTMCNLEILNSKYEAMSNMVYKV